jgi:hypothetical protein
MTRKTIAVRHLSPSVLLALAVALPCAGGGVARAAEAIAPPLSVDAYNVVWDSPAKGEHDSMPLGNGDICLNAWVEPSGDLVFYISKTDAWDDNARLVKVGKVRVHLEPSPFAAGAKGFRQTLSLRDATMRVEAGEGAGRSSLQVWVDANWPVVHVAAATAEPTEATASNEVWRTERVEYRQLECSDIMTNAPADVKQPTIVEPDTVLKDQQGRIGWYHHNVKSFGPKILADIQGLAGFKQADPLLGRTFGAIIRADKGEWLDGLRLRSPSGKAHRFSVYVLTKHPATPEQWLADMDATIRRVEGRTFADRRAAHEKWWAEFWDRSWIRAVRGPGPATGPATGPAGAGADAAGEGQAEEAAIPASKHPLRVGSDQGGGNKFVGEVGRVSVFARALPQAQVKALAALDRQQAPPPGKDGLLHSGTAVGPVDKSQAWDLKAGLTIEAWIKPDKLGTSGARIVDKITPGGSDGFLLDTYPGNSLRFICGHTQINAKDATPAGQWTHVAAVADPEGGTCTLYVDGKPTGEPGDDASAGGGAAVGDEAGYVSQMYHLQRFINACAGRGAHPIKFNGTLFTVAPAGKDGDYRRWGPGYWWQNTRLPYISMCTSGDFDLMKPLFRMYAGEVLELSKYRTKLYCGHDGVYLPECIYFWGPIFSETYGWQPCEKRTDKLQASGWHKWEWVGGLELCWMMLDYYDHTQDREFLSRTGVPFIHEILTFFDQHYRTGEDGKIVMHPGQALETWWECTNPMPELAGCVAVTERLLTLPESMAAPAERELWQRLHGKLPALPVREVNGRKALTPAEKFAKKSNCENPELYAVFPFRLVGVGRPNIEWGIEALHRRGDRGHFGWRQDDVFMAYLGLAGEARRNLVARATSHDRGERFPAFWGPNYDWTPDQDHGGILLKTFQAMLLQTDGEKVYLLPAWPKNWDADFRLRAPQRTVIQGKVRGGKLAELNVTPPERRKDVVVVAGGGR